MADLIRPQPAGEDGFLFGRQSQFPCFVPGDMKKRKEFNYFGADKERRSLVRILAKLDIQVFNQPIVAANLKELK